MAARVIQFPVAAPQKLGPQKVKQRKKSKPNPEDLGQLSLFEQGGRVVNLPKGEGFFDEALRLDETSDPEAEKYYLLAIEHGERIEDSWCNLGILKSQQGQTAASIDYLTRCLQVNPRHFEAHYNLGNVYSDLGNFLLAKNHYEVAVAIMPEHPNTYYNLGLALISLKKYPEAIQTITKYLKLAPESDHGVASELLKTLKALA